MNDLSLIRSKIYEIRGTKVMLDYDLAAMYGVETRVLNQAVKRNLNRFPHDFMFQLDSSEWNLMSSQFVMTSNSKRPKSSPPYAFTEHGVVMLSSVLRSDTAVQINIAVTRAFVEIRKAVAPNALVARMESLEKKFEALKQDLEDIFEDYNDINEDTRMQLDAINVALADLQTTSLSNDNKKIKPIGFVKNT